MVVSHLLWLNGSKSPVFIVNNDVKIRSCSWNGFVSLCQLRGKHGYRNRVCSSRRWRKLVIDLDVGDSQGPGEVYESSKSHVLVLCMKRNLQGEAPNPKKCSVGFGFKTIESMRML